MDKHVAPNVVHSLDCALNNAGLYRAVSVMGCAQLSELGVLILTQDWDDPQPLNWDDAFHDVTTCGLMRETETDALSVLSDVGFDETTGVDTALGNNHKGAMLCAGFLMLECDE